MVSVSLTFMCRVEFPQYSSGKNLYSLVSRPLSQSSLVTFSLFARAGYSEDEMVRVDEISINA